MAITFHISQHIAPKNSTQVNTWDNSERRLIAKFGLFNFLERKS